MNLKKALTILLTVFSVVHLSAQTSEDKPLRTFQLSMFPLVGTDGIQTKDYRYQVSLNMFMGITGGLDGIEAGGFMNIASGRVEGLQLAGFGNVVKGDFKGFQSAGFLNIVNGSSEGLHFAGFLNTITGDQNGVMAAGFMNVVNGSSSSVRGAGFMNVNRGDFQGISGAGFMNVTAGNVQGIKGAGFMNVAMGESQGMFGAGFANINRKSVQGTQMAGFMNVAGNMQGIQMAGFLNVASRMEGLQLGFINISDTISGLPVGFLSIVKKGGLRQFELAASDVMYASASFKIGVSAFYNIFSVGYRPFQEKEFSAAGYGIGTRINLTPERSFLQLEAHTSQIYHDWDWWDDQGNFLNEIRTIYTHNLSDNVQLFGGVVLYNHIFKTSEKYPAEDLELSSWTIHENQYNEWTSQWWAGARAGVSFVIR